MGQIVSVRIADNSDAILKALGTKLDDALEAIGKEAVTYAQKDCPVDTGRLRASIAEKVISKEKAVYIGTNVEYAPYVEYNERAAHNVGKAHFIRDAAANHGDHYKAIVEAILRS